MLSKYKYHHPIKINYNEANYERTISPSFKSHSEIENKMKADLNNLENNKNCKFHIDHLQSNLKSFILKNR